jgi:RND family efflux transporter MFP subunit
MSVRKAIIILIIIAILGLTGIYIFTRNNDNTLYSVDLVKQGKIIQTVSETGKVKADKEINLGFQVGGLLKKINVKVGDIVEAGRILAELDNQSLLISKKQAEAGQESAKGNLSKLLSGATTQEIAIAKADYNRAKSSYEAARREYSETQQVVNENIKQAEKSVKDLESNSADSITSQEQAIIVAQTNLNSAKSTYQKSIDDTSKVAISTIDDKLSVANKALDVINSILTNDIADDYLSVKDETYLTKTINDKNDAVKLWNSAITKLNEARTNYDNIKLSEALNLSLSTLNMTFSALQNCYHVLEYSSTSWSFPQTSLDVMKTNISSQQTILGAAVLSMQTAKQNFDSAFLSYKNNIASSEASLQQAEAVYNDALLVARNNLVKAQKNGQQQTVAAQSQVNLASNALNVSEKQLDKVTAPANQHDIELANAEIKKAQAAVEATEQNIKNNQLSAPIKGTITKINFEEGEQAPLGTAVISMLGENNFEIEILISEADIAKININDKVVLTLDAFGDDVKFEGQVYFIDPAETDIQDVVYYKVKISLKAGNKNVKSGMTANAVITTSEKDNVIIIPSRSIIEKQTGEKIVKVLKNLKANNIKNSGSEIQISKKSAGEIEERTVTTGIYGDESLVEITNGLNVGEYIIVYINDNNK